MARQERALRVFLRVLGSAAILAAFFVPVPYSWMNAIHQWLGMGELPDKPIVGYLARSTSAFYALLGGLLWTVSTDVRRHRLVLRYLGGAIIVFGLTLLAVDLAEGMPRFWSFGEGPINTAFGVAILALASRLKP